MKTIFNLCLLFLSFSSLAAKPELVIRYSNSDSWRLPAGEYCFNNTPVVYRENIYLRCGDGEVERLYKITNDHVSTIYQSQIGYKLSDPVVGQDTLLWSEYAEGGTSAILRLHGEEVSKLGFLPKGGMVDGLAQVDTEKYIFRWRNFEGEQFLTTWKMVAEAWSDHPDRSFAFTPASASGQLAYKLRLQTLDERSPDFLYWWKDLSTPPLVLADRDADAESPWQSFRNTVSLSGVSMIFVGKQKDGIDALGMMNLAGKVEVLARVGMSDLKGIDYFSPSLNKKQMVLFRGLDQSGMRALFLWRQGKLMKVLCQGDVVHTDKGIARIDYSESDAVFMSAPFLAEDRILIQTALVDIDDPKTLIGVGLIQLRLD